MSNTDTTLLWAGLGAAAAGGLLLGPLAALPGAAVAAYAGWQMFNSGTWEDAATKAAQNLTQQAAQGARNAVTPETGIVQTTIDSVQGQDWAAVRAGRLVLRRGSKGPAVKALQRKLISLGIQPVGFKADGDWGQITDNAVKVFRTRLGGVNYETQKEEAFRGVIGFQTSKILDSMTSQD